MWPFNKVNQSAINPEDSGNSFTVADQGELRSLSNESPSSHVPVPMPFALLPNRSKSALAVEDDPYSRDLSCLTDSVADTPPAGPSKLHILMSGAWIENPRARACYNNVKLGVKMGAIVGGVFGALAGSVYSIQARQLMLLPATMLVCGGSFGFFLGCGMIIRCEGGKSERCRLYLLLCSLKN
jgi:hypothetical protein